MISAKEKGSGCLWVFVAVFALFIFLSVMGRRDMNDGTPDAVGVRVVCERLIKERLASPGSAAFPGPLGGDRTNPEPDGSGWVWTSYVDSQNRLGATLRTHFTCRVENDGEMSLSLL